jgi:hypothetical protein
LDQLPATAPQVNYQNGLLSITAQNSTLADILREVRKRTGASIEIPANATERVVTHLGPGSARDVLASLLNGSSFNYVMLGVPSSPSAVSSVVLTTKPAGGAGEVASRQSPQQQQFVPQQMPPPQMQTAPAPPGGQAQGDENADSEETADENQDEADQGQAPGENANPDGSQPNSGPKTPEQMLEMLRQQQQQQGVPGQMPPMPPSNPQPPENQ